MPPDNTKATAGNGGESQNIKASDLLLPSLSDGTDFCRDQLTRMEGTLDLVSLSLDDRQAAFVAGFDLGCAQRVEVEVEDRVQARLHTFALEALGMARRSAVHGPAFSAMVTESGQRE